MALVSPGDGVLVEATPGRHNDNSMAIGLVGLDDESRKLSFTVSVVEALRLEGRSGCGICGALGGNKAKTWIVPKTWTASDVA